MQNPGHTVSNQYYALKITLVNENCTESFYSRGICNLDAESRSTPFFLKIMIPYLTDLTITCQLAALRVQISVLYFYTASGSIGMEDFMNIQCTVCSMPYGY